MSDITDDEALSFGDEPNAPRRRRRRTFDTADDTPQRAPEQADDNIWNFDLDAAPRDGREVALLLSVDPTVYKLVTWRRSRRMINYKWQPDEGWSDRFTRQMYYDMQPLAWALHDIIDGLRKG